MHFIMSFLLEKGLEAVKHCISLIGNTRQKFSGA